MLDVFEDENKGSGRVGHRGRSYKRAPAPSPSLHREKPKSMKPARGGRRGHVRRQSRSPSRRRGGRRSRSRSSSRSTSASKSRHESHGRTKGEHRRRGTGSYSDYDLDSDDNSNIGRTGRPYQLRQLPPGEEPSRALTKTSREVVHKQNKPPSPWQPHNRDSSNRGRRRRRRPDGSSRSSRSAFSTRYDSAEPHFNGDNNEEADDADDDEIIQDRDRRWLCKHAAWKWLQRLGKHSDDEKDGHRHHHRHHCRRCHRCRLTSVELYAKHHRRGSASASESTSEDGQQSRRARSASSYRSSRHSYSRSRSRRRSRNYQHQHRKHRSHSVPEKPAPLPAWQSAAHNALRAGAMVALAHYSTPGPWLGEKGSQVATAALGAALVDTYMGRKHPKRLNGVRHTAIRQAAEYAINNVVARPLMERAASRRRRRGGKKEEGALMER